MTSFTIEQGPPVVGRLVYREDDYAFATEPRPATCGASFTINEVELMLDHERQCVVFVEGYCPDSGWRTCSLRAPVVQIGLLRTDANKPIAAGVAIGLNQKDERWPVLVDPAAGWVRLGKSDPDLDREGVQFAPGAVAVLDGNYLRAIWLHPDRLPSRTLGSSTAKMRQIRGA